MRGLGADLAVPAHEQSVVIAVDGTAASGKGTLAKKLAAHFGFAHLDSGALYRLTALAVLDAKGDPKNEADAVRGAQTHRSSTWRAIRPSAPMWWGRRHPMSRRSRPCGRPCWISSAAFCASPPGGSPGAVMDGRDIGTVICPDATAKLYIDARPELRAHRRWLELKGMGIAPGRGGPAGGTQCPGRRRQIPPDFAPDPGPGRRLARYLRFGYRRGVRGSPCPGFPQGRGRAQGPPQGLRRPGGFRATRLLFHKPNRPCIRMGSPVAHLPRKNRPFGMHRTLQDIKWPAPQPWPDQYREFHRLPQPRRFRGHAGTELRDPVAPGRRRHQGQDRRHRE